MGVFKFIGIVIMAIAIVLMITIFGLALGELFG